MQNHGEVMDQLLTAMAREQSQLAMLVAASQAAKAEADRETMAHLQGEIDQKVAYLAFLKEQFNQRLN